MKRTRAAVVALALVCAGLVPPAKRPFERDNLVAWCIVPFDAKNRGPKERAEMLVRLGIKRVAYDWRDEHVKQWDDELEQYRTHGIEMVGFWAPDHHKEILELFKRHGFTSQLWLMGPEPKATSQEQRLSEATAFVATVARLAKQYGCKVGLYNHGGWFGEPENQLAIIERLRKDGLDNVGIVYNLHHAGEQLARFPQILGLIKPHLLCLNLNGMRKGGPQILPIGQGDDDLSLLKAIRDSGYAGPIGILNHRHEVDAEQGLRENIEGLKKLLAEMNDEAALKTYRD